MSFKDGGLYSVKDPNIEISNLTGNERVHNLIGQMIITDHINKLEAVVTYNPKPEGSSGMFQSLKNKFKKQTQLSDALQIQIFQKSLNQSKQKVVVSEGSGSWLEYIEFDGKLYWTVNDERPTWLVPNDE